MEVSQFDKITTAILRAFEDSGKAQDAVFNNSPLFALLNKKGKKQVKGGREIQVNINYKGNDTVQSYSGWDLANTTPQDTLAHAIFPWALYRVGIAIDGETIAMNNDAHSVIDLVSHETEVAIDSLKDQMAAHMFLDGTGNAGKDLIGLDAHVSATGTLGGIARATYPWWRSQTHTAIAPMALSWMSTMINNIMGSSGGDPTKQGVCDLVLMPQNLYEAFESLILPYARTKGTGVGDLGFTSLAYKGTEIAWDSRCQAGRAYFLSTKYLGLRVMPGRDFSIDKWREPVNQDGRITFIKWMGQLVSNNCRRLGVATNKTA